MWDSFLLIAPAFAQDTVGSAASNHAADVAYDWVCSNPTIVKPVLYLFAAYLANNAISAVMKKYGVTKDSPIVGIVARIMRLVAMDVKPPDAVVVKQAATIVAAAPEVVAATQVSPEKMAAAAEALKKG